MYDYFLFIICIAVELRTPSHSRTLLNQAQCRQTAKKVSAQEFQSLKVLKIGFGQDFLTISKPYKLQSCNPLEL